ncbi:hypothetical protein IAT38_005594 [Cryptococcus sp. DSM 104549]
MAMSQSTSTTTLFAEGNNQVHPAITQAGSHSTSASSSSPDPRPTHAHPSGDTTDSSCAYLAAEEEADDVRSQRGRGPMAWLGSRLSTASENGDEQGPFLPLYRQDITASITTSTTLTADNQPEVIDPEPSPSTASTVVAGVGLFLVVGALTAGSVVGGA